MTTEVFKCPVCGNAMTEPICGKPDMRRCKHCYTVFNEVNQRKQNKVEEEFREKMSKAIAGID